MILDENLPNNYEDLLKYIKDRNRVCNYISDLINYVEEDKPTIFRFLFIYEKLRSLYNITTKDEPLVIDMLTKYWPRWGLFKLVPPSLLTQIIEEKQMVDILVTDLVSILCKAEVKHRIEQEPLIKAINLYQNERIVDKDRYNQFLDRIESKKIKEYIESELDKKRKQYPNDIILEDKITDKTHVRRTMLNDLNQNKIEEN